MKISFLCENLQEKLPFLTHAVSGRSQLPVLSNFLLETEKGKLKISATDLEIGIISFIPANIEKEGGITVPAKTFTELINNLQKGKITIETDGQTLKVIGGKTKAAFQTMSQEDFPKIYEDKGEEMGVIKAIELDKELVKIVFSASQDSARPALSGILIKKEGEGFSAVATDGFRLSLKKNLFAKEKKIKIEDQILVSSRVLRELVLMKKGEGEIGLSISGKNNQIMFWQNETVLVGRLIEAEYPSYEKIIPVSHNTRAQFSRDELTQAVKICSVFARETANIIKLSIEKNKIIVSANTPSVGENAVEIEGKIEGEENEIAFNARYLLEFLSNMEEEALIFEMNGPLNPGVFKIAGDNSFLHLIMPIRVQG